MWDFLRHRMTIVGFPLTALLMLGLVFIGVDPIIKSSQGAEKITKGGIDGYIDAHNHLVGRFRSRSGSLLLDYEGAARVALATMNKLGIRKMLIMPPPFPLYHPHRYDVDDFIDIVRKYPNRFAFLGGGGTLNVMIQRAVHVGEVSAGLRSRFEKKAEEILSKGALGFGEMAAEHFSMGPRHPYESAPPDHPLFLLLVDIAARHDVPVDIHMEAIPEKMPLPARFSSPPNPRVLAPNIVAFERLLAHNRKAKIIWAHVGWDNTGYRSVALCAELLERNPNLFMSFKISPRDSRGETCPIERGRGLKIEWLKLIRKFPDRFIIGSDQFYVTPRAHRQIGPPSAEPTKRFLSLLPPDLAHKIGCENARRIFKLDE